MKNRRTRTEGTGMESDSEVWKVTQSLIYAQIPLVNNSGTKE